MKINDAEWHHVSVVRFRGNHLRLTLDHGKFTATGSSKGHTRINNGREMIFGASVDSYGKC